MKKVAIVGVEGSGKTVMLAGLGDLYTYPDEDGYFLAPKNFGTAAYVAEKIERMRKGEWPSATAGDEMQGLDWTLKRREPGVRKPAEKICEVSFLDFAGEVYREAYGISSGSDASLKEQAEELKKYVCGADELIVLINLRDVITNGLRDKRVQEAMWITKSILDTALGDDAGTHAPRAAIVLSQADSYAETIKSCGGALGVLEKYLPHVANDYGWLDVFAANAVDKTVLDDDGNVVPAADFTTQGLLPVLKWIRGEGSRLSRPNEPVANPDVARAPSPLQQGRGGLVTPYAQAFAIASNEKSPEHDKVQLWEGGPYWAETNIGAKKPEDYGFYFWWGDTAGYKREGDAWVPTDDSPSGFELAFDEEYTPTYGKITSALKSKGWITSYGVLTPKYDPAQVQWGEGWRMPTRRELEHLCDKCDWSWTSVNGVNGYVIRGRGNYASVSIFLPCAGSGDWTSLDAAGSNGYYWSSVPDSDDDGCAWYLDFNSGQHGTDLNERCMGCTVRPVQGFTK